MTALAALLDAPAATTLAWTLLHFLWQGAALAAALWLVTRYASLTASTRYAAGVVTLALMLLSPVATFAVLASQGAPDLPSSALATPAAIGADGSVPVNLALLDRADEMGASAMPSVPGVIVVLWAAGVLVLAARLLGGWVLARRLVHAAGPPVAPEIESMAVRIAGRLALDRVVRVAQSSAVAVPVMVGWLKPVVLFPASVLAGLSPTQIEALLAHELAHIRRHDYLVNLLQSVVETLLFYHPGVWWVSRRVRVEREHCCDDIALGVCDRLVYATALTDLATLTAPPRVALAATDGSLLQRVRRILAGVDAEEPRGSGWLPVLAVVLLAALIVPVAVASTAEAQPDSAAIESDGSGQAPDEQARVEGVAGGVSGGVQRGVVGGVPAGQEPDRVRYALERQSEQELAELSRALAELQRRLGSQSEQELAKMARVLAEMQRQTSGQSEQERVELARRAELARQMAELERQAEIRMRELELRRHEIEEARLEARHRAELDLVRTELAALVEQRDLLRKRVETGTATPAELADTEKNLRLLEQRLRALDTEFQLNRQELELRRQQTAEMRELEQSLLERERARRSVLAAEQRRAEVEAERDLQTRTLAAESASIARTEALRAGDVLVIEIRGEPDVPRAYTVAADGTIRLPLSRPIRVAGLTAVQVEQEITKQLTARGLESVAVEVMPRRPR